MSFHITITIGFAGREHVVRMLIGRGVNVNDVNSDGDPILVFSAAKGKMGRLTFKVVFNDYSLQI